MKSRRASRAVVAKESGPSCAELELIQGVMCGVVRFAQGAGMYAMELALLFRTAAAAVEAGAREEGAWDSDYYRRLERETAPVPARMDG